MKKYLLAAALIAAPVLGGVACAKAKSESSAPSKISHEDMLQLTIDAMQLDKIQQAANEAAKGVLADRAAILKKYDLDWQKLGGEGAEQSVATDGTITRKAHAAPADMGAPAKGKK